MASVADLIVEDPMDIIRMLMSVSEEVSEYINTQAFITDNDIGVDGVDIAGTAVQCYMILIDELRRKGILFYSSEELLENWADAERIFHLHQWIDTANQIEIIRKHPELVDLLDNILHNEDSEESLLTQWVNVVAPKTSMDVHVQALQPLLTYIDTNDEFKDLLEYIFKQVQFLSTEFKQPIETISTFIQAMYKKQQNAIYALQILRKHPQIGGENVLQDSLDTILEDMKNYDVNKLQPEVISDYAWAWTIEEGTEDITYDDLPDTLKKKYDDLELEHHSTTNHHPEYYLVNKDKPFTYTSLFRVLTAVYNSEDLNKSREDMLVVVTALGDRIPNDLISLKDLVINVLVGSNKLDIAEEKFHTRIKDIAKIILKTPRMTQKQFTQEAKAGDIIISYKKASKLNYFNQFSSWLTSTFQGMRYNSSKMVYVTPEGNKMVVGYGVKNNGSDFSKMSLQSYLTNCGGCLLIRHSNINSTKREKLNKLIGEYIEKDLIYSNSTIITTAISHILEKSFNKNDEEDKYKTALICSTIIAILYRQVDLDIGSKYSDTEIWPVDIIQSSKLNKIGMYFAKNEYDRDEVEKMSTESLDQLDDLLDY